ncbi:DUF6350 family protein [Rothia kristinae]|nr:DUF6350 family protein [Rothia kristinae]
MTPRRFSLPRTLPMPLWLQGAVEILVAALAGLAVVAALLLIGWFSLDGPGGLPALAAAIGQVWLGAHGVGLQLDVPATGRAAGLTGTAHLLPLGLTLVLLLITRRAGARLARASWEGEFWKPVLGGLVAYAGVGAAVAFLTGTTTLRAPVLASTLVPLWVPLLGMVWGGHRESGSWLRLIGIAPEGLAQRYSQYTRWAGAYALSVLRAAGVGLICLVAGGALMTGISVFAHWQGIIAAYQALHAGLTGDLTLFLLQLALLPNLILCATAWSVGAGFSLGEGTLFSPAVADGPALPALPVFAAMPTATGPYSFAVLVLPVLAGALAAWWFLRAGEDHVDDWFSLRIGSRVLGAILSGAVFAVILGALTGAGATLLAVLARGGLGAGPFAVVGPHPGAMFCWSAVTVAIGAVIGRVVSPWFERDAARGGQGAAPARKRTRRTSRRDRAPQGAGADAVAERNAETSGEDAVDAGTPSAEQSSGQRTSAEETTAEQTPEQGLSALQRLRRAAPGAAGREAKRTTEPEPTEPVPTEQKRAERKPVGEDAAEELFIPQWRSGAGARKPWSAAEPDAVAEPDAAADPGTGTAPEDPASTSAATAEALQAESSRAESSPTDTPQSPASETESEHSEEPAGQEEREEPRVVVRRPRRRRLSGR